MKDGQPDRLDCGHCKHCGAMQQCGSRNRQLLGMCDGRGDGHWPLCGRFRSIQEPGEPASAQQRSSASSALLFPLPLPLPLRLPSSLFPHSLHHHHQAFQELQSSTSCLHPLHAYTRRFHAAIAAEDEYHTKYAGETDTRASRNNLGAAWLLPIIPGLVLVESRRICHRLSSIRPTLLQPPSSPSFISISHPLFTTPRSLQNHRCRPLASRTGPPAADRRPPTSFDLSQPAVFACQYQGMTTGFAAMGVESSID